MFSACCVVEGLDEIIGIKAPPHTGAQDGRFSCACECLRQLRQPPEIYTFVCIIKFKHFTWKAAKRTSNLKKHGVDFADAGQVFTGPTITEEDARDCDAGQRFNTTGFLGAAIVTISHAETENEIHIISMRKAEPHEIDTLSRYL